MSRMHKTALRLALRHGFRLARREDGLYSLRGHDGRCVAVPAWGERTAAGAVRMMRRQLRLGLTEGRALYPVTAQQLRLDLIARGEQS